MRISEIDTDPERKALLVQHLAEGTKHQEVADLFGVHKDTIGEWKKRPDVQAAITAYIRRRSNDILSLVDTSIQKRLEQAREPGGKSIPTETLLSMRKTYAGERLTIDTEGDAAGATEELMELLHRNPALAAEFAKATAADADGN